jgi:hypothetical protein
MFAATADMSMITPHSQDVVERLKRTINAAPVEFDADDAVSVPARRDHRHRCRVGDAQRISGAPQCNAAAPPARKATGALAR